MSKHENEDGKKLTEKFNLRARPGQVIPYSQADDELRGRMKTLMAPIKQAPDSFEALIGYGHAPLEKLGRVATRMIGVQEKFSAAFTKASKALDDIQNGPADAETKALGQSVEEMIMGSAMGSKTAMTEQEQEELVGKLHKKMAENIGKSVETLLAADAELEQLIDESRRVQRQRRDASREIGLHMGAGERLSEKFEGKFLKKAAKQFGKSGAPEAKQRLKDVFKRGDDFGDRVAVLEGSRVASLIAREQLSQMNADMWATRANIAVTLATAQEEWKPLFQSTGINPFAPKP